MTETLPAIKPPSVSEWSVMRQQAEVIAKSGLAPKSASTPEKILTIALKGRELSMPIMQSLSHIYVVDGKPTLSAEAMVALVQRAGHKLRVIETNTEKCVVEGVRKDDSKHPSRLTFTIEEARQAGLTGKSVWKQYQAALLRARAISALCRFTFADVLSGASYTPEELDADVPPDGDDFTIEAEDGGDFTIEVEEAAPSESRLQNAIKAATEAKNGERGDEKHSSVLNRISSLYDSLPEEIRPPAEDVVLYAGKSTKNALLTLNRLQELQRANQQ